MNSFINFYNQSNAIEIDQINTFKDDKLFISVGGCIGSGKTYFIEKFIDISVIDVDDCVKAIGQGIYNRIHLAEGRKIFQTKLEEAFKGNESFVHVGTNSNLNGVKQRLLQGKENGFTNILVLIDTNIEKSIKQIQERIERKEIAIDRVKQSYEDSLKVFNSIKDNKCLVDFYVHHIR